MSEGSAPARLHRWLTPVLLFIAAAACRPPTLEARLVNAERKSSDAEKAMDQAEAKLRALEPGDAADWVDKAKKALADPDVGYYPEREQLRQRLAKDEAALPGVRQQRDKRDLDRAVDERRQKIDVAAADLDRALEPVHQKEATAAEAKAAQDAATGLASLVEDGKDLEPKSAPYAARIGELRPRLEQARSEIAFALARVGFADGPATDRQQAGELEAKAKVEKDKGQKAELLDGAREKYARCADVAAVALNSTPALVHATVLVAGAKLAPVAVQKHCSTRAKALLKTVAALRKAQPAKRPGPAKTKKR